MNYYFEDFTETNYKTILQRLLHKGYEFIKFDYEKIKWGGGKTVLWRHDVDYSLNRAYQLADIEERLGITATYFIHMQSNFYNIFEPSQYEIIEQIISRGHAIGLHFDHGFYTQSRQMSNCDEIEKHAGIEKEMMEKYFGIEIKTISFHNPEASHVLELGQDYYAGMMNAYSQTIFEHCKYCSDSNGYWRYDRLQDVIESNYEKLHILTHPEWWVPYEMSPYERVKRCVDGRRDSNLKTYCDMLDHCGRDNVGYKA